MVDLELDCINAAAMCSVDAALQTAWANSRTSPPLFYWNQNRWLNEVFGSTNAGPSIGLPVQMLVPPPVACRPVDAVATAGESVAISDNRRCALASGPAFLRAVRRFKDLDWTAAKTQDRHKALSMWKLILDACANFSNTGRQMIEDCSTLATDETVSSTLRDTFDGKATGTLYKRAGAVLKYMQWCSVQGPPPVPSFPICEAVSYRYIAWLKDSGKSALSGSDFRSAVAFCHGVIGLDHAETILSSGRCKGAASSLAAKKRRLEQVDPFTAEMVICLERILADESIDMHDRHSAGHFHALTYFRSRFGDAQYIEHLGLDLHEGRGFIEAKTSQTKTSNTARKRNRFLAMAAPAHGLLDTPWAQNWIDVRTNLGLECGRDVAFFPAVKPHGAGFYKTPMKSAEANVLLRSLLEKYGHFDWAELLRRATHSCKTCFLSWGSKFGLELDIRRMLGYHALPGDMSVLTYSRDAMSEPLRQLQLLLDAVATGAFLPDATRSGRFSTSQTQFGLHRPDGDIFGEPRGLAESPAKKIKLGSLGEESAHQFAECLLCGQSLAVDNCAVQCNGCERFGCNVCMELTQVDGSSICNMCFNRSWPYPDNDIIDICSEQNELRFDESEDDDVSNYTSEDSDSDSGDDPLVPLTRLDDDDIHAAAVFVAESDPAVKARAGAKRAAQTVYRHKTYKTLHFGRAGDLTRLACGREVSVLFDEIDALPLFPFPKCFTCFGTA